MIDTVYYTPTLRIHRDGTVERYFKRRKDASGVKRSVNDWHVVEPTPDSNFYLKIMVNAKSTYIHRLVGCCFLGLNMEEGWNSMIDHIDRNPSNNRVDNLRIVNNQENQWNNECKGYYYDKQKKKYHATIRKDNEHIFLGLFNTAEDARKAYLDAKKIYHTKTASSPLQKQVGSVKRIDAGCKSAQVKARGVSVKVVSEAAQRRQQQEKYEQQQQEWWRKQQQQQRVSL